MKDKASIAAKAITAKRDNAWVVSAYGGIPGFDQSLSIWIFGNTNPTPQVPLGMFVTAQILWACFVLILMKAQPSVTQLAQPHLFKMPVLAMQRRRHQHLPLLFSRDQQPPLCKFLDIVDLFHCQAMSCMCGPGEIPTSSCVVCCQPCTERS